MHGGPVDADADAGTAADAGTPDDLCVIPSDRCSTAPEQDACAFCRRGYCDFPAGADHQECFISDPAVFCGDEAAGLAKGRADDSVPFLVGAVGLLHPETEPVDDPCPSPNESWQLPFRFIPGVGDAAIVAHVLIDGTLFSEPAIDDGPAPGLEGDPVRPIRIGHARFCLPFTIVDGKSDPPIRFGAQLVSRAGASIRSCGALAVAF